MTYHQGKNRLRCHHCNKDQVAPKHCPDCKSEVKPVGQGTERIEEFLRTRFPTYPVIRIDRDTTRSKEQMHKQLAAVHAGGAKILVGTQMLTKGHDFPDVTLVGVLDADSGLFSSDFRSSERLAQQIVQVSGRAGRAEKPGLVLIQTLFPEHPILNKLTKHAYTKVAEDILNQREEAEWPPFSHLALLRVEAKVIQTPMHFLNTLKDNLVLTLPDKVSEQVNLLGPAYAPMAKRAGFFRGQLLFQSASRANLHQCLHLTQQIIAKMKTGRKVRWSIDVDPVELY
jgi:primosomal protein N' (replication factor Y)